eukprot:scaffold24026_cov63-Isochrysis_galbana.AAC.1
MAVGATTSPSRTPDGHELIGGSIQRRGTSVRMLGIQSKAQPSSQRPQGYEIVPTGGCAACSVGLVALQEDAPRQLRDLLDGQVGAAGQRELLGKGADLRGWWRCGGVNKGWRRCETASWSTSAMRRLEHRQLGGLGECKRDGHLLDRVVGLEHDDVALDLGHAGGRRGLGGVGVGGRIRSFRSVIPVGGGRGRVGCARGGEAEIASRARRIGVEGKRGSISGDAGKAGASSQGTGVGA